MGNTVAGAIWRKSSYSGSNGGGCVDVADNLPGIVAVRDSKDPNGPSADVQPRRVAGVHQLRQAR